jgi:hypothetical protein
MKLAACHEQVVRAGIPVVRAEWAKIKSALAVKSVSKPGESRKFKGVN